MALAHVDDAMRLFGVEADDGALPYPKRTQASAPAGAWRRQMRRSDVRLQFMLRQRVRNPRNEITAVGVVIGMLKLTSAAFGKVTAWRHLMVRTISHRAVFKQQIARDGKGSMLPGGCDAVPSRSDPDDRFSQSSSSACGMAAARSSAII